LVEKFSSFPISPRVYFSIYKTFNYTNISFKSQDLSTRIRKFKLAFENKKNMKRVYTRSNVHVNI